MLTEEGVTTRLDSLITKGVQERDWDIKEGSDPRRFVPPFAGFGSSNCGRHSRLGRHGQRVILRRPSWQPSVI
jgi:hypothetical protein